MTFSLADQISLILEKFNDSIILEDTSTTNSGFFRTNSFCAIPNIKATNPIIISCAGFGIDANESKIKAISEAVERRCSALVPYKELKISSFSELQTSAISPRELPQFTKVHYENQKFPFSPFTKDTIVAWTSIKNANNADNVFIPASIVYNPYTFQDLQGEVPTFQPISTGCACHTDLDEAVLNGILEVLERDAIEITWRAQLELPRINLETIPEDLKRICNALTVKNYEIHLLDISLDHKIPIFLAVAIGNKDHVAPIVVGAAADLDETKAARKALLELTLMHESLEQIINDKSESKRDYSFEEQIGFWSKIENLKFASFLTKNELVRDLNTKNEILEDVYQLISILDQRGKKVLIKNLTTDRCKESGVFVVKVVIPSMIPIASGTNIHYCIEDRLGEVLQENNKIIFDQFNPHPNPFT